MGVTNDMKTIKERAEMAIKANPSVDALLAVGPHVCFAAAIRPHCVSKIRLTICLMVGWVCPQHVFFKISAFVHRFLTS